MLYPLSYEGGTCRLAGRKPGGMSEWAPEIVAGWIV